MQTIYFVCEDMVVSNLGTYTEVAWIVQMSFIKPDMTIYKPCFVFRNDNNRLHVWVHGGVGREPSELFVRLYLKRSDHPLVIKFRNGAFDE